MRALAVILVLMGAEPSLAADVIIHDGDSLTLGNARYRLHDIDAPELDQVCLDENGGVWACGIQARDRLKEFIGGVRSIATTRDPILVFLKEDA